MITEHQIYASYKYMISVPTASFWIAGFENKWGWIRYEWDKIILVLQIIIVNGQDITNSKVLAFYLIILMMIIFS